MTYGFKSRHPHHVGASFHRLLRFFYHSENVTKEGFAVRIILSPAKQMREEGDTLAPAGLPQYLAEAGQLADYLRGLSLEELRALMGCNEKIAALNWARYQQMDLERASTPALLAYDGIQYQYMAPRVFEGAYYTYVQEHLRILSGLYGVLRPLDAVTPYRLEMGARLKTPFCRDLYDFWGDKLARAALEGERVLLDLSSWEYGKGVARHLPEGVRVVKCVFGERAGEKIVEKSVHVKMARGEMVRFLAERGAESPEEAKAFDRLSYHYSPQDSTENRLVFLREESGQEKKKK